MTVLTPILYQAFAVTAELPGLGRDMMRRFRRHSPSTVELPWEAEQFTYLLQEFGLARVLQPVPFPAFAAGAVGIPLLTENELKALFSNAKEVGDSDSAERSWWDFWRADGEYWAMFPGNIEPDWQVSVPLPIASGRSVQLRVLNMGLTVDRDGRPEIGPFVVPPTDGCVHEADQDEAGAPYRGRCRNSKCPLDCEPRVVVHPDDGLYRLMGCTCSG